METEDDLGDHAQGAERAAEQLGQVVAGDVLDHLAAGPGHGPVGQDHGDADDQVAHGAVAQPPRPRGVGRHHPAEGGPGLGRVEGQPLAGRGQGGLEIGQAHARLGPHDQVAGGVLQHLVQAFGGDEQVGPLGRVAQPELAPAAHEHHRQAVVGGGPEDLAGLLHRPGAATRATGTPSTAVPGGAGPTRSPRSSSWRPTAQNTSARPACSAGWTRRGPGRSPHSRGVGNTLPGLARPRGRRRSAPAAWCPGPRA